MLRNLRPLVFWPTFLVLMAALLFSLIDLTGFLTSVTALNDLILKNFSWVFSLGSFYLVVLAVITYFSPLANLRIGGSDAKPMLTKPRWFFVTLCTTIAVGLLFWTTAEPIYHLNAPPASMTELSPGTPKTARFAISAMYLHWSFTPYAIYAIPSLVFALAFYNRKLPFSISSSLEPVFGKAVSHGTAAQLIDTIAMYALVTGMAASLGTSALTLIGGIGEFSPVTSTPVSLGITIALVVGAFVASAASGLHKGIARLSAVNVVLLLLLGGFVFIFGPTVFILTFGAEGLGEYLGNFLTLSLFTGASADDIWPKDWSVFYWAVWFAWAPVSALFLGRIARGYTVREFLQINLIFPSLFAIVWIAIFSGTSINIDLNETGTMNTVLNDQGIEKLLYFMMGTMPFKSVIVIALVFIAFISYVTAADSNTDAIGTLCTKDFTAESSGDSTLPIKVLWGTIIGFVAWIMVSFAGVDGIRMLSNLGGLPAMLLILAGSLTLIRWLRNPTRIQGSSPAQIEAEQPPSIGS